MKKYLIALLLSASALAQTVNPNQIKPATVNGYILTTVGGVTVWAAGSGGTGCTPSGTVGTFLLAGTAGTCTSALADYNVSEPDSFDFHPVDNMNFVLTGGPDNNFNVTNDGNDNFTPKGAFNVSSQAGYQISNTVNGNVTISNTAPGGFLDVSTQGNRNDSVHGTYNLSSHAGMNFSIDGGDFEISAPDVAIYAPFWIGNTAASGHVVFDNSTIIPGDAFVYTLPRLNGTFALYTGALVAGHCAQVNSTSNGFIDSGNPCGTGGGLSWSSLTNPTGNLSLGMAARSTTFTFNAATGGSDLFSWTDGASNTGTGILGHFHTASASTEIPWQADANGKGFLIDPATGALKGTGFGSIAGVFGLPAGTYAGGTAGVANYTSDATNGYAEVDENNTGRSRICTLANAVCATSTGLSGMTATQVAVAATATTVTSSVAASTTVNGVLCALGSSCTVGIANITVAMPTSLIAANTCTSPATATMTGLATSSTFTTAFATNPNAVTGWGSSGGLLLTAWPTANTLNWSVCNPTASGITPGAMTINVGAR